MFCCCRPRTRAINIESVAAEVKPTNAIEQPAEAKHAEAKHAEAKHAEAKLGLWPDLPFEDILKIKQIQEITNSISWITCLNSSYR